MYPLLTVLRYGYATNTRMKFVIITENTTSQSRDNEINPVSLSLVYNLYHHTLSLSLTHTHTQLFKKIHTAYVDMFCNPFYVPNSEITSK